MCMKLPKNKLNQKKKKKKKKKVADFKSEYFMFK